MCLGCRGGGNTYTFAILWNTIFTVSSVISVILAALSVGYYVGGRFSDRHPSLRIFFSIITLSGLTLLFFHFIGTIILPILGSKLSILSGPLISSLLLFFLPAFLLGTLSPYAVKLQSMRFPHQGVGSVAGRIFFWSTFGSITGSLAAGFLFIPHFGINQIIITNGAVLFLLGFLPLLALKQKKYLISFVMIFVVLMAINLSIFKYTIKGTVYAKDGVYEKIIIHDEIFDGRPTRFFQQDLSSSGAMFLDSKDPKDLVYPYSKYYALSSIFNKNIKDTLVIGGGAYSLPKAMLAGSPDVTVDVSEIEPSLYDLAKEYFDIEDNPRLHNYVEDGRRLLAKSDKKYDFIFGDAYFSFFSVPPYLTTREFFQIVKDGLNKDGIFMANMIGDLSQQENSLTMSEIKTLQNVFPNSYFFAVNSPDTIEPQNIIFVGYNSDKHINFDDPEIIDNPNPIIGSAYKQIIDVSKFDLSKYPVMTDNYSPVEYMTGQVLKRNFGQK